MPMFMLLACRFFISSVILAGLLKVTNTPIMDPNHPEGRLSQMDWIYAVLQGIFAAFLFNIFFVWGLQYTHRNGCRHCWQLITCFDCNFCSVWLLKESMKLD